RAVVAWSVVGLAAVGMAIVDPLIMGPPAVDEAPPSFWADRKVSTASRRLAGIVMVVSLSSVPLGSWPASYRLGRPVPPTSPFPLSLSISLVVVVRL
ncbi:hypothetical protein BC831DRAFT_495411, partial [Entophlyctis helioformis]